MARDKKLIKNQDELNEYYESIVFYIRNKMLGSKKPILFVPVLDGGLYLFYQVVKTMEKDWPEKKFDYQTVAVKSYKQDGEQSKIEMTKPFVGDWKNHFVVILDDVYDSGKTSEFVIDHLLDGHGIHPNNLCFISLVNKHHQKSRFRLHGIDVYASFSAQKDRWLVGCGMDSNLLRRWDKRIWLT